MELPSGEKWNDPTEDTVIQSSRVYSWAERGAAAASAMRTRSGVQSLGFCSRSNL